MRDGKFLLAADKHSISITDCRMRVDQTRLKFGMLQSTKKKRKSSIETQRGEVFLHAMQGIIKCGFHFQAIT
jgi:hypothetical protein